MKEIEPLAKRLGLMILLDADSTARINHATALFEAARHGEGADVERDFD